MYYYPSYHTLERGADGLAYVVNHDRDAHEPFLLRAWWPTGLHAPTLISNYGAEVIGARLYRDGDGRYHLEDRRLFVLLKDGGQTLPTMVERIALPQPRQRGKVLPLVYELGHWKRELASGKRVSSGLILPNDPPVGPGPATNGGMCGIR